MWYLALILLLLLASVLLHACAVYFDNHPKPMNTEIPKHLQPVATGQTMSFNVGAGMPSLMIDWNKQTQSWEISVLQRLPNIANTFTFTPQTGTDPFPVTTAHIDGHGGNQITASSSNANAQYQWFENGVAITGATHSTYTPTSSSVTVSCAFYIPGAENVAAHDTTLPGPTPSASINQQKKIVLTRNNAIAGCTLNWRINGGATQSYSGGNFTTVSMPSNAAILEYWQSLSGYQDSIHETVSWNDLEL